MSDETTLNTKALDNMIKAMKGKVPTIKVGILGSHDVRDDGQTNASIGTEHEFGTEGLPKRSFLRMPLSEKLNTTLEKDGLFDKKALNDVIKEKTVIPWLKKIAVSAEAIVQEAFETGGFGKWPPWRNPNYKNGNMRILDDTGQLRAAITSEIQE